MDDFEMGSQRWRDWLNSLTPEQQEEFKALNDMMAAQREEHIKILYPPAGTNISQLDKHGNVIGYGNAEKKAETPFPTRGETPSA